MSRRIVINLDTLSEADLSINEFCALWDIYEKGKLPFYDTGVDYKKLQKQQYIKIITNEKDIIQYVLRQEGTSLIDLIVRGERKLAYRKSKKKSTNVDVLTKLTEFRNKWKGLKSGSMGSLQSCREKLERWMDENPGYTFDEILKAADLYINSLGGDYRFLQRADYFIYKQNSHKEDESRLSAFIDEIDDSPQQGEWTTRLN